MANDQRVKRRYPPFFEKLLPLALIVLVILFAALLIMAVFVLLNAA